MKSNTFSNANKIYDIIGKEEGTITSISIQKQNKLRYSVYLNHKFLIGTSEATLIEFGLKKGLVITQAELDDLVEFERVHKVKDYLLRLLARRDHTSRELLQKAIKKGYTITVAEKCIGELESKGYINNGAFAQKFAHDKFRFNHWGAQKIRIELIKKGVPEKAISTALSQISKTETLDQIGHLFEKSKARFLRVPPEKRQKKIFDFFVRKGYDVEVVLGILPDLLKKLES